MTDMNQGGSKYYKEIHVKKQEVLSVKLEFKLNPQLGGCCHTLAHTERTIDTSSIVPNFKMICADIEEGGK